MLKTFHLKISLTCPSAPLVLTEILGSLQIFTTFLLFTPCAYYLQRSQQSWFDWLQWKNNNFYWYIWCVIRWWKMRFDLRDPKVRSDSYCVKFSAGDQSPPRSPSTSFTFTFTVTATPTMTMRWQNNILLIQISQFTSSLSSTLLAELHLHGNLRTLQT